MSGSAFVPLPRASPVRRSSRRDGRTPEPARGPGRSPAVGAKSPTRLPRLPATVPGMTIVPRLPPPVPRPARSWPSVVLATAHPWLQPADQVVVRHPGIGQERLVEHGVPGHLAQRAHLHTGLVHVDGEVGDPLVLGRLDRRPGDEHAVVGGLAQRGPHLLAVHDPLVTVAFGTGGQAGEVRAGAGLAEQLAPRRLPGDDVAHQGVDLLRVPRSAMVGAASSRPRP